MAERQHRRDLERLSAKLVFAQEEERRSLARELHDAVGQALTAIKMEMGVALRGATDSRTRAALDDARTIAESTLQSVRDLSQLLRPSMLDDFGLPEALGAYLRNFSTRTGIRTELSLGRMSDRLPPEIEVCVYRIVQEALTNIARHSGASSCTVVLFPRRGTLTLSIEDDGRGIDETTTRAVDARRGLGLIGMRERAQALAGSFVIENRSEGGTRVTVLLPEVIAAAAPESPQQLAGCPTVARLRILLADDHTVVRQGLRKILEERPEWEVVAEAGDGREAVRQAEALKPDIAIIDISMPLLNGIEATGQIIKRSPSTRVLVLTMYSDEAYVNQVLKAGATGYLLKDSADVDLLQAVSVVAKGQSFFSPAIARLVLDDYLELVDTGIADRYELLSSREREVFQLIAEGKVNKETAALLNISPSTVETHRARIMEKLDLHSAAEIVLYAARRGVIK